MNLCWDSEDINMWTMDDKGYGVESLQEMLKGLGHYEGQVDGKYGRCTQRAVARFQEAERLDITGTADDKTLWVLAMRCAVVK